MRYDLVAGSAALLFAAGVRAQAAPQHAQGGPDALYVRDGALIVKAPAADLAVARRYPAFADKGEIRHGQRLTIMSAKTSYRTGEAIRVIHVLEAPKAGKELYVMGPKPVEEEYVDDQLASPPRTLTSYDGRVLRSPGADFNYEITVYRFDEPGEHAIQWKGGGASVQGDLGLVSNVLRVTVTRADE